MGGTSSILIKAVSVKKYNKHGDEVLIPTGSGALRRPSSNGEKLFDTREEAVDQRTTYSSDEKAGLFGHKRKNLFGN